METPQAHAKTLQTADTRLILAESISSKIPIEEVQLAGTSVKVVCPPYSALLHLFREDADRPYVERYLEFVRDRMLYASFDEKTFEGELLFAGEEGRRLFDYFITADNESWRLLREAADRVLKPFLEIASAPNSTTPDSPTSASGTEPASGGADTGDSGIPSSSATSNIRSTEPSSDGSSASRASTGASPASGLS